MAESIIQRPFRSYIVVASSSSASDTYKNKLQGLKSYFDNLSLPQKIKSFILFGNTNIYHVQRFNGIFGQAIWSVTGNYSKISSILVDLESGKRVEEFPLDNGTVSIRDTSDTVNTTNVQLCYFL